jgi:hypothetical protein
MRRLLAVLALVAGIASQRLELDRKGQTIVLEPYAPNILRVTLSLKHESRACSPWLRNVVACA